MRSATSKKAPSAPRPTKASSSPDDLARCIEGAKLLRDAGFTPCRVVVGGASIDIAVSPWPRGAGAFPGQDAPDGPQSLAEEYLGKGAAAELDDKPSGDQPSPSETDDGDYEPAVRK